MGVDDEDGIRLLSPVVSGSTTSVQVFSTGEGFLDAWFDFNDDGDWDDEGEQIFSSIAVSVGQNLLTFSVPSWPFQNQTGPVNVASRFRLSRDGGLSPTRWASDGEVEDYRFLMFPPNIAPSVHDDVATTREDTPVEIDFLANDSDDDGVLLFESLLITQEPRFGAYTINTQTQRLIYVPEAGFIGQETIAYRLTDNAGIGETALITIDVHPENVAPHVNDDAADTAEDQAVLISVLSNDTDTDGLIDAASLRLIAFPNQGRAEIQSDAQILYRPMPDFFGADVFFYEVCDDDGSCSQAQVSIDVTSVDDPPDPLDDVAETISGLRVVVDVLANDVDRDGDLDPSSVDVIQGPSNGVVESIDGDSGEIRYTPSADFVGSDQLVYSVTDLAGNVSQAKVVIEVAPRTNRPVANDDFASVSEDEIILVDVLLNDLDVDGDIDITSVSIITPPVLGDAFVDPTTGQVSYEPRVDHSESDSLVYQITDAGGLTSTAVVLISIQGVNDAPDARDDEFTVDSQGQVAFRSSYAVVGSAQGVLENDREPEGQAMIALLDRGPENADHFVLHRDGAFDYVPQPGFSGVDSFTYVASDGLLESMPTTVVIHVAENTAPELSITEIVTNRGEAQRSSVDVIQVQFSHDTNLQELIDGGEISQAVTLLGPNAPVLSASNFVYDEQAFTLRIDFTDAANRSTLSDGRFRLRLDTQLITLKEDPSRRLVDDDNVRDDLFRDYDFHRLLGDFDGDADVDGLDSRFLLQEMGKTRSHSGFSRAYDLDDNGRIDIRDYLFWKREFGKQL